MANTSVIWGPGNTGLVLPANGLVGTGTNKVAAASTIGYTPTAGVVATDVQAAITELSQREDADPRSRSVIFDDFHGEALANTVFGPLGLATVALNGGSSNSTLASVPSAAFSNSTGLVCLSTGVTSNATGYSYLESTNSATFPAANASTTLEWRVLVPATLSTGAVTYTFEIGWRSVSSNARATNAVSFLYDSAVSTNWAAYTANNTTATTVTTADATYAVAVNTWYNLKIVMVSGLASFYVAVGSGAYGLIGTSSTNLPDVTHKAYLSAINYKTGSATTTATFLVIDWAKLDTILSR